MRKGRIKYYFKNKKTVINDVGKLCDMNEQLEQELDKYKNIIDELEKDLKNLIKSSEEVENKWASEICIFVLNKLKELRGFEKVWYGQNWN